MNTEILMTSENTRMVWLGDYKDAPVWFPWPEPAPKEENSFVEGMLEVCYCITLEVTFNKSLN